MFCFNPLGRGVGIGGPGEWDVHAPFILRFNPLGRGVGIGGCALILFGIIIASKFQSAWTRRRYWGKTLGD